MALYLYVCSRCWSTAERFVPADERDDAPLCEFCESLGQTVRMQRSIIVPAIRGDTVSRP